MCDIHKCGSIYLNFCVKHCVSETQMYDRTQIISCGWIKRFVTLYEIVSEVEHVIIF